MSRSSLTKLNAQGDMINQSIAAICSNIEQEIIMLKILLVVSKSHSDRVDSLCECNTVAKSSRPRYASISTWLTLSSHLGAVDMQTCRLVDMFHHVRGHEEVPC